MPLTVAQKVRRYRDKRTKSGFAEFRAWVPKEGIEEARAFCEALTKRLLAKRKDRDDG